MIMKLILLNFQSPGDIVMLTAAVRDLHQCCPGQFLTDVRTPCPSLWENNPHLLAGAHTRATESHHARTRPETTKERARRLLLEDLDTFGWTAAELANRAKGDARKIRIAQRLRTETVATL